MADERPLRYVIEDSLTTPLYWKSKIFQRLVGKIFDLQAKWDNGRLEARLKRSGFNATVDQLRYESIVWRARRHWKAWHLHDILILLKKIKDMEDLVDALLEMIDHEEGLPNVAVTNPGYVEFPGEQGNLPADDEEAVEYLSGAGEFLAEDPVIKALKFLRDVASKGE